MYYWWILSVYYSPKIWGNRNGLIDFVFTHLFVCLFQLRRVSVAVLPALHRCPAVSVFYIDAFLYSHTFCLFVSEFTQTRGLLRLGASAD